MSAADDAFGGALASWRRRLTHENRSPRTIQSYLETATQFSAFLGDPASLGDVGTADVESWIIWLLEHRSAATARLRYASLKQLFRWATAEGEIDTDPMIRLAPPAQPEREVPLIPEDQLKELFDSLDGNTFEDRRDAAICWVLLSTGIRAAELIGMTGDAVDLDRTTITVIGKGDRERTVAIGSTTVLALDRYQRARRRHPRSVDPAYWLGPKGGLTDSGLRQLVRRRGAVVGIDGLHPHQFRHQFAHRWKAANGSDEGLMAAAGWRSPQMLARYGASAKAERSRAEAARLGLEDL